MAYFQPIKFNLRLLILVFFGARFQTYLLVLGSASRQLIFLDVFRLFLLVLRIVIFPLLLLLLLVLAIFKKLKFGISRSEAFLSAAVVAAAVAALFLLLWGNARSFQRIFIKPISNVIVDLNLLVKADFPVLAIVR